MDVLSNVCHVLFLYYQKKPRLAFLLGFRFLLQLFFLQAALFLLLPAFLVRFTALRGLLFFLIMVPFLLKNGTLTIFEATPASTYT